MNVAYYIYIFDYPSESLYEIAVSEDNKNHYTVSEVIENNGFNLNDINYMCCDNKLDKCSISY